MGAKPKTIRVDRKTLLWLTVPIVLAIAAAYVQWAVFGLPPVPPAYPLEAATGAGGPRGFPSWICVTHYVNFLLIVLAMRSGLQILMDHPRLYWNVGCAPGTDWIRFTTTEVPTDRLYTAKDDARYLSPWIGLPGGRHTLGLSRHWHFVGAMFWILNGVTYVVLLFATGQWARLVPTTWQVVPDAWSVFVHYATFHLPPQPDGFYQYDALQQLAYFGVVFILAPLQMIAAGAMSPALVNRYAWYPKLPGNRQIGRSLHFLFAFAFVAFLVVHVTMVVITGFERNMNHIVLGKDDSSMTGIYVGLVGLGVVVAAAAFANWASHNRPRIVQHVGERLVHPVLSVLLDASATRSEYTPKDISPYFWRNGKLPTSAAWAALKDAAFEPYRLKVSGLVDNPVELSLAELEALGKQTQITLHHCIQGWSGIASWGGLPMAKLIEVVRPKPYARFAIFYSFGEGGEGGEYYDSHTMENLMHPQALLAYEMNSGRLTIEHGAPLRLRVENQLGFKMVKWIREIEFVEDPKRVRKGEGGYNEDNEFFDCMADI